MAAKKLYSIILRRSALPGSIAQAGVILFLAVAILFAVVNPAQAAVPIISIKNVVKDTTVTVLATNFPVNEVFTVRMGEMGTQAVGGIVVGTLNSGAGGSFEATFNIPAALVGRNMIAIRMDSSTGYYYSYNWFYNDPAAATGGPYTGSGYTGIPTFSIKNVVPDATVTITTSNFPANETFTVRMGAMGTKAVGGVVVGTVNTGGGGVFEATFNIPASLAGSYQIAMRMDSSTGYYYAYNWFYNIVSTGATGGPYTGYTGIPTFSIKSTVPDTTVTITTSNFPVNETFTARMGAMGTKGVGGIVVGTLNTGGGGVFEATFTIPASLAGSGQIAIRLDSSTGYYYAYNWFYNSATTGTATGGPYTPTYNTVPTISIVSAVKDTSVTIQTWNFPAGQTFNVYMGPFGSEGIGGYFVTTTDSGAGGSFSVTYPVPAALVGSGKIAIRLETANGYYYSYNWFYNN